MTEEDQEPVIRHGWQIKHSDHFTMQGPSLVRLRKGCFSFYLNGKDYEDMDEDEFYALCQVLDLRVGIDHNQYATGDH